jgi:hypothetical protein
LRPFRELSNPRLAGESGRTSDSEFAETAVAFSFDAESDGMSEKNESSARPFGAGEFGTSRLAEVLCITFPDGYCDFASGLADEPSGNGKLVSGVSGRPAAGTLSPFLKPARFVVDWLAPDFGLRADRSESSPVLLFSPAVR